jgi:hypothetical protein
MVMMASKKMTGELSEREAEKPRDDIFADDA